MAGEGMAELGGIGRERQGKAGRAGRNRAEWSRAAMCRPYDLSLSPYAIMCLCVQRGGVGLGTAGLARAWKGRVGQGEARHGTAQAWLGWAVQAIAWHGRVGFLGRAGLA